MQQPPKPKPPQQMRQEPPLKPRKLSEAEWKKFVKNWVAFKKKTYEAFNKSA